MFSTGHWYLFVVDLAVIGGAVYGFAKLVARLVHRRRDQ
jgi:hypothetical protein